jgi:hypothetical protein
MREAGIGTAAGRLRSRLGSEGRDRILNLKPDEIGYQKINSLKIGGVTTYTVHETILK